MCKLFPILIFFSVFSVSLALGSTANVICYFTSWTIYRPDNEKFAAENVDPSLCTHINYAYVGITEDGSLKVLDDWEATEEIAHLVSFKNDYPDLKIMLSMGGWNEGSTKFSNVAADPIKRANNINSVMIYMSDNGFDGFDLDWEYPCQREGKPEDRENFVIWLSELKSALNAQGYILSAAVSGICESIDISYDVPGVSANLDLINVMAFDYHEVFENVVGHPSPLYASNLDQTDQQKLLNVASGIQRWLDLGTDPNKINLGTTAYGSSFILANESNTDLYAPTISGETVGYHEICEFSSNWPYVWDDEQKVPHKVSGNQWVGYDDADSLKLKVEFAKSKNLGGMLIWSLDADDFRGICGDVYPLLKALNRIRN